MNSWEDRFAKVFFTCAGVIVVLFTVAIFSLIVLGLVWLATHV